MDQHEPDWRACPLLVYHRSFFIINTLRTLTTVEGILSYIINLQTPHRISSVPAFLPPLTINRHDPRYSGTA
jgi:hypothetical protein